jgi:hypothetical protein
MPAVRDIPFASCMTGNRFSPLCSALVLPQESEATRLLGSQADNVSTSANLTFIMLNKSLTKPTLRQTLPHGWRASSSNGFALVRLFSVIASEQYKLHIKGSFCVPLYTIIQPCLAKFISLQELHEASVRRLHFAICYPLIHFTAHHTGLALVDAIASKDPSAIIYAGARDPSGGAAQLKELVAKYPGRVEVVKYVAGDKEGNDAIAAEIKAKHGRVDTVIANAGEVPSSLRFMIWFTYIDFTSTVRYRELWRKGARNACRQIRGALLRTYARPLLQIKPHDNSPDDRSTSSAP